MGHEHSRGVLPPRLKLHTLELPQQRLHSQFLSNIERARRGYHGEIRTNLLHVPRLPDDLRDDVEHALHIARELQLVLFRGMVDHACEAARNHHACAHRQQTAVTFTEGCTGTISGVSKAALSFDGRVEVAEKYGGCNSRQLEVEGN